MNGLMINSTFWLIVMIVTGVIEAATAGLVTIWFTLGALASLIASVLGASVFWQIIIFIVVSAALLAATRPLVKKYLNDKKTSTNADRLIGASCIVTEGINTLEGKGAVKVFGQEWSAKCKDTIIPKGMVVRITGIEGVHVLVKPENKEE